MAFLAGIHVICFAASYAIAWLLEISRLVFRGRAPRFLMLVFAGAGLLTHTLFLAERAQAVPQSPLSSSFDWCLVAAWLLVIVYLYLAHYHPQAGLGLFVLPIVLGLITASALFADREPLKPRSALQVWGTIHGVFLLLGTVVVMIGFAAGLMYLVQASRLKRKRPPMTAIRLPSLEWLEMVNSRVVPVSAVLVAVGFAAGVVLKTGDAEAARFPWSDPIIWSSGLMLAWLVAAALFNAIYTPARHGRKVAYLTIASFVFLSIALGVLLLVDTSHGKRRSEADSSGFVRVARAECGGAA